MDAIGLTELAARLDEREEPDVLYLLMKACNYDYALLFNAADVAADRRHEAEPHSYESGLWRRANQALADAAVEALRSSGAAAEKLGESNPHQPRCPNVTVDLDAVRQRSEDEGEAFFEALMKNVQAALRIAGQTEVWRNLKADVSDSINNNALSDEWMTLIASYINLTSNGQSLSLGG